MKDILTSIHALPEDTRKVLAGISIAVLGLGFFGVWSSFMSSRLVTLNAPAAPQEKPVGLTSPAVARGPSGTSVAARPAGSNASIAISPAAGIAGSARSFFASIGSGLAAAADAIYMNVAPWVPPY